MRIYELRQIFRVYGRVYNGGLDENLSGMMKTHLLECEKCRTEYIETKKVIVNL